MIAVRDVHGRSPIETIIEMFIIITVAPVIVCCIVQAVTIVAAIALPWVAITVMVIGVVACMAALFAASAFLPMLSLPRSLLATYQFDICTFRPWSELGTDWLEPIGLSERSWMRIMNPDFQPGAIVASPVKRKLVACVGPMSEM